MTLKQLLLASLKMKPSRHIEREGSLHQTSTEYLQKFETMKKSHKIKCLETAQKLVDRLLGHNAPPENMPALKYGREMEAVEKQKYLRTVLPENQEKLEMKIFNPPSFLV